MPSIIVQLTLVLEFIFTIPSVNLVTASQLLGICRQRLQQLIYAKRVKGAFKTKQGWQIPLYRQMPQISPATRGVKGTWRLKPPKTIKILHINRQKIATNRQQSVKEPVIAVRKGSKVVYGHRVTFNGQCTIVYEPENRRKHGGAKVWLEMSPTTQMVITDWNRPLQHQVTILD